MNNKLKQYKKNMQNILTEYNWDEYIKKIKIKFDSMAHINDEENISIKLEWLIFLKNSLLNKMIIILKPVFNNNDLIMANPCVRITEDISFTLTLTLTNKTEKESEKITYSKKFVK